MDVLFITYHYLIGNYGGAYASRAFINAFAEISDNVDLLYPMRAGAEPTHINQKVKMIPVWDNRSRIRKGMNLLLGCSNRFRNIHRYVLDKKYDLVVLDNSLVVHGVIDYFKKKGTKVITIHHNFNFEYYRDNTRFPLSVPLLYWAERFEREAVRKSDLNLTLTASDKTLLSEHYGNGKEKIEVLGAFEFERKPHVIYSDIEDPIFLITGSLCATQTERSLLPWIEDYYPILKEVFPSAQLILAGKEPSETLINKSKENGIKIIPSPESMQPILAKSKFYICATSLGGGLKLRVMDGLSAGLPVVCHKVSARGYEKFIESGVLLEYNDQDSFRNQLETLKVSKVNKQKTIELYEKVFSFESGRNRFRKLLQNNGLI